VSGDRGGVSMGGAASMAGAGLDAGGAS
jgi:hypothetical protein